VELTRDIVDWFCDSYCDAEESTEQWNHDGLALALKETFGLEQEAADLRKLGRNELAEHLEKLALARYEEKEQQIGPELMRLHERLLMLQIVDTQWKDHLYSLDHLKEGIGLRGYGQRDPLVEYKKESFAMFQALGNRIDEEILRWIFLYQPVPAGAAAEPPPGSDNGRPQEAPEEATPPPPVERRAPVAAAGVPGLSPRRPIPRNLTFNDPGEAGATAASPFSRHEAKEAQGGADAAVQTVKREAPKVGRNDPCPCGSGKKYKKCHGAN
jgi:preprotein translocase subunit SecA